MHNILYTNSEANNNKQDESIRLLWKKKEKKIQQREMYCVGFNWLREIISKSHGLLISSS